MSLLELLRHIEKDFEQIMSAGEALAEAKHLLSFILKCEISDIYIKGNDSAKDADIRAAKEFAERRKKGEPLAYILGERWFMGLRFKVDGNVLIPRQDTELIAESAIEYINKNKARKVLDMCTGSGCIAVSIAKYTNAEVWAADISEKALAVAKENAEINGVCIRMVHTDLFEKISDRFDLIVCNPPYVSEAEYRELMREVRLYEPKTALVPDEDGLGMYRRIAAEVQDYLNADGAIMLEIGCNQGKNVTELLEGFENIRIEKDLAGKDRMVFAKRKNV